MRLPSPNLKFNHKVHVDRNITCGRCHGRLAAENVTLATRDQLPKMGLCLQCHGKHAPGACSTCHLTGRGGFLKTNFDSGQLVPSGILRGDDHDAQFRTSHRLVAQNGLFAWWNPPNKRPGSNSVFPIVVGSSAKPKILRQLRDLGVRPDRLFPDAKGVQMQRKLDEQLGSEA